MSDVGTSGAAVIGRTRCPTCGAARHGESVCHRCKSDLRPLIDLELSVDALTARARRCYARGWYRQAAALAGKAVSLEQSPESLSLLACASIMAGDFPSAAGAWRRALQDPPG
ncbi:MAG TPA: hypothetical protein VLM89_17235 [Phycisphaerae bacterium]|nr:hypothetical protein [Phycisphaerae bacterium]